MTTTTTTTKKKKKKKGRDCAALSEKDWIY
jgi:hypothetical protein